MSNYISQNTIKVIAYPYPNLRESMSVNGVPWVRNFHTMHCNFTWHQIYHEALFSGDSYLCFVLNIVLLTEPNRFLPSITKTQSIISVCGYYTWFTIDHSLDLPLSIALLGTIKSMSHLTIATMVLCYNVYFIVWMNWLSFKLVTLKCIYDICLIH